MLPLPPPPEPVPQLRLGAISQGERLLIGGRQVNAAWRWEGNRSSGPELLWLPLDLLESELGFRNVEGQLEWFGRRRALVAIPQRTLGDEVGLEVADWLISVGVKLQRDGTVLQLTLPAARLKQLRRGQGETADRLVLDLDAPLLVQRRGDDLALTLQLNPRQRHQLSQLGLRPQLHPGGVILQGQATRLKTLSLAGPWRLVLDGITAHTTEAEAPQTLHNPVVAAWLRRGLVLERRTVKVGVKPLEVVRAGGDLAAIGLSLQPLAGSERQTGLRFLPQMARPAQAVVAVNGGFFNRILEVPLGALRRNSRWLSGPILNRGVIAWSDDDQLHFGRLSLQQSLWVNTAQRHRLDHLNSGFIQRGLSRYTRAWGRVYHPLSGQEQALLIRDGLVTQQLNPERLKRGVVIPDHADLVVARGGIPLPAQPGDRVRIFSGSRNGLGRHHNVVGGGPLLVANGRIILNGQAESFSSDFLALKAPRTVVGQGRDGTWLITLRGINGSHPTLLETALVMRQLGLKHALNLDGGSSTTVVAGGHTVMNGRGGTPRVHNGLGLVPLCTPATMDSVSVEPHGRQPPPHHSSRCRIGTSGRRGRNSGGNASGPAARRVR